MRESWARRAIPRLESRDSQFPKGYAPIADTDFAELENFCVDCAHLLCCPWRSFCSRSKRYTASVTNVRQCLLRVRERSKFDRLSKISSHLLLFIGVQSWTRIHAFATVQQ